MGHLFSTPVPGGSGLCLSVLTLPHLQAVPVHGLATPIAPERAPSQKSGGCTTPAGGGIWGWDSGGVPGTAHRGCADVSGGQECGPGHKSRLPWYLHPSPSEARQMGRRHRENHGPAVPASRRIGTGSDAQEPSSAAQAIIE